MTGIFAAIPFAIWFFLAIEGAAMAAEEAKDPKRTIPRAYIAGILTLVVLAIGVMLFAGGAGDWRKALSDINDPLPQAMKMVVGENSSWMHMLVWIGLFGLVASFHGIILGYSRQFFALARAGYLPRRLAKLSRFQTPHRAIIAGGVVGIAAIYSDGLITLQGMTLTAAMITMSVFGAIVMYIMSMLSLFKLRRSEPDLERSFRAPGYPRGPGHRPGAGAGVPGGDAVVQPGNRRIVCGDYGARLPLLPRHQSSARARTAGLHAGRRVTNALPLPFRQRRRVHRALCVPVSFCPTR